MTGIRVTTTTGDLESDFRKIATQAPRDMRATVRDGIKVGNTLAKDFAREKNGPKSHSQQYPGKFSAEMHGNLSALSGAGLYSGEYGPSHEGQGELASILENGSRRGNAPQQNLARSADIIGPSFAQEVSHLPDRWFWPES